MILVDIVELWRQHCFSYTRPHTCTSCHTCIRHCPIWARHVLVEPWNSNCWLSTQSLGELATEKMRRFSVFYYRVQLPYHCSHWKQQWQTSERKRTNCYGISSQARLAFPQGVRCYENRSTELFFTFLRTAFAVIFLGGDVWRRGKPKVCLHSRARCLQVS